LGCLATSAVKIFATGWMEASMIVLGRNH